MGRRTRDAGSRGEGLAAAFLAGRGCDILARNVRLGPDEIDLIVRDVDRRAAVEVKYTRRRGIDPLEAVDPAKLDRIRRAASSADPAIGRIDLVGITERRGLVEIRWLVGVA